MQQVAEVTRTARPIIHAPPAITHAAASREPPARAHAGSHDDASSAADNPGSVPSPNTIIPSALCNGVGRPATVSSIAYTKPQGSRPITMPSTSLELHPPEVVSALTAAPAVEPITPRKVSILW